MLGRSKGMLLVTVIIVAFILLQLPRVSAYFYNRFEDQAFKMASAVLATQHSTVTKAVSKKNWFSEVITYTYVINPPLNTDGTSMGPLTMVFVSRVMYGPLVRDPVSGHLKIAIAAVSTEGNFSFAAGSPLSMIYSQIQILDKNSNQKTALYHSAGTVGWDGAFSQTHTFAAVKGKLGEGDFNWDGMQVDEKNHFAVLKPTDISITQNWQVGPLTAGNAKGAQVKWDGMTANIKGIINSEKADMNMDITVGALQGTVLNPKNEQEKNKFSIEKFSWQAKSSRTLGRTVTTGSLEISLPLFTVMGIDNEKNQLTLKNLIVSGSDSETATHQYDYFTRIGVGALAVQGASPFSASDSMFDFSAKNLSAAGMQMIEALNHSGTGGATEQAQLDALSQALFALINTSTDISSHLNLNTSVGNATVAAHAVWNGAAPPKAVMDLMTGTTATLDIRLTESMFNNIRDEVIKDMVERRINTAAADVPTSSVSETPVPVSTSAAPVAAVMPTTPGAAPVVDAAPSAEDVRKQMTNMYLEQLDGMIKQGFIVRDNKDYLISINYKKGVLTVNGKTLTGGGEANSDAATGAPMAPTTAPQ